MVLASSRAQWNEAGFVQCTTFGHDSPSGNYFSGVGTIILDFRALWPRKEDASRDNGYLVSFSKENEASVLGDSGAICSISYEMDFDSRDFVINTVLVDPKLQVFLILNYA
jgi:hypothetical protein